MPNFKIGDTVIFNNSEYHELCPDIYPVVGTSGKVTLAGGDGLLIVKWQDGSTSGTDEWICYEVDVLGGDSVD